MWARERRVWASGGEALASPGLVHTLRKKFARTLRAFRKYRDEDALRQGWDHALEAEEALGGSYFALLTHPALEKTLAQEAMGHVHMLSHVAASALRRVRSELDRARSCIAEQEVALERVRRARMRQTERLLRLRKRVAAQHFAARSTAPALSEAAPSRPSALAMPGSAVAGPAAELGEIRDRLEKSEHERRAWRRLYRHARQRIEALESEDSRAPTVSVDGASLLPMPESRDASPEAAPGLPPCDLAGRVVAYVGGRGRVVPRMRALTERCNGRFIHHDGGLQERAGRIDESLAGSDIVIVPLDCVSHDASRRLKRRCRQQGKAILWLRTASLSAFENALHQAVETPQAVPQCALSG